MLRVCYSLAALAVALATCDALQVTTSFTEPMDPTLPHRVLQQWYTVAQDDQRSQDTVQTLKISIPGRVFVSYSHDFGRYAPLPGPDTAAMVRFSGNSEELFDLFEVVANEPNTLEIRRRPSAHGGVEKAYLLTEISLNQAFQVSQIIATGTADLVIDDRVLINNLQTPLKLSLQGSGDIHVDTRSSTLAAEIEVAIANSGSVYWTASAVQTASYTIAMLGSGDLNWISNSVDSTKAEIAVAGSGDLCISASSFRANTVKIETLGSGEAWIAAYSTHCNLEQISVLGSGDVDFGTLQCSDAVVNVAGSGDVFVQASHSITGSIFGSGEVKYSGNRPQLVSDRRDASVFSTDQKSKYKPIAVPAESGASHRKSCKAGVLPLREAVAVKVPLSVSGGVALGPLILFAVLSLCYLRSQRKKTRRDAPRFGQYAHAAELHPLVTSSMPPLGSMLPPQQPPPQQQQQQQQGQVYV